MAGNVTAFNTVWTYDIYQSYIRRDAPDSHYLRVGRMTTIVGVALSIGTAYLAQHFNNIMDFLQLVFGFVMRRCSPPSCWACSGSEPPDMERSRGLLTGTAGGGLHARPDLAEGKGGWIATMHEFPSTMAQNFWIAIFAWTTCFVVTILVSLVTKPRPESELQGLVLGLTKLPDDSQWKWYQKPGPLAVVVLGALLVLNVIFW